MWTIARETIVIHQISHNTFERTVLLGVYNIYKLFSSRSLSLSFDLIRDSSTRSTLSIITVRGVPVLSFVSSCYQFLPSLTCLPSQT